MEKFFGHLKTINHHKKIVFLLCLKCGLIWQGIIHDMSKYTPTEFWEGVKYYHGDKSPNNYAKKDYGYSKAWLHHQGCNKHHHEYWYDYDAPNPTPMIPYKYVAEMICDNLAAGMTYNKEKWTPSTQYEYWEERKDKFMINEQVKEMVMEVLKQVSEQGVDKTITKDNLQKQYIKYCGDIK